MDIHLRYSIRVATKINIEAMTKLHCESFRPNENVPMMLGPRYVKATYRWFVTSKRSYALVAEDEDGIKGLIAVCDGPFTYPMFMACLGEFFFSLIRYPSLLLNRSLWRRLFRRPDVSKASRKIADQPGFAQMIIGAVDKNIRGKGVFPELVKATISISRKRGSWAIRAGIYKSNHPSRRVFIKGGWIKTPELETEDTVFYVYYLDPTFPRLLGLISKDN